MKKSTILGILTLVIMPVTTIIVLGMLQGAWFDAEKIMERDDIEMYAKPLWQYVLYYIAILFLAIIHIILVLWYTKISRGRCRRLIIIAASIIMFLLIFLEIITII